MGQQCSCFDKSNEKILEQRIEIDYNPLVRTANESNKLEPNEDTLTKTKLNQNNKNQEDDYENNSQLFNKYTSNVENITYQKTDIEKKDDSFYPIEKSERKINKFKLLIQKNILNWYYKKLYDEKIKDQLISHHEEVFKKCFNLQEVKILVKLIDIIKNKFDNQGWKKFYDEIPQEFEFGKIFQTKKIYIEDNDRIKKDINDNIIKSYVYLGEVNKFNQKNGRGQLYYLDGSCKEEGIWLNDSLNGWCRIIYSNGIIIEGK